MTPGRAAALVLSALVASGSAQAGRTRDGARLGPGPTSWRDSGRGGIRGVTVGPIESTLHPGKGYGSEACARTMAEVQGLGANWVSLTPFGRTWDLAPTGVDPTFEAPFAENRAAVARAIAQAHRAGLRVLLVPHLWVESGQWRALIDPGDDAAWKRWARGYRRFVLEWAKVAEASGADMLSLGVELRSWVTTTRAPLFSAIAQDVRREYSGLLTYASNWDDVESNVILGELDVIGVNAFFPLASRNGSGFEELRKGGVDVARRMRELAGRWQKPVLFTEIGYTTRKDPAIEPWIWPDAMKGVEVDQPAQAEAYAALIAPLLDEPWFAGFFVWRVYADPDDMSQEAEWGFSPRGKLAELIVRDAFAARWAADGAWPFGRDVTTPRSTRIGP
jgi:hypothetical protein